VPQPGIVLADQLCPARYRASRAVTARYRMHSRDFPVTAPGPSAHELCRCAAAHP